MAFTVNTNVGAMAALQSLSSTNKAMATTQSRINTGMNVSSTKDDSAAFTIAQSLRGDMGGLQAVSSSLNRAKSGADLDRLVALVVEHEVTEVVVGEPRHLSGASGASAVDAGNYAQELADRIADVPVHMIDERLSTVTAASHLREGGIDSRRQRPVIDQAAAVVILQQYLDSRRTPT